VRVVRAERADERQGYDGRSTRSLGLRARWSHRGRSGRRSGRVGEVRRRGEARTVRGALRRRARPCLRRAAVTSVAFGCCDRAAVGPPADGRRARHANTGGGRRSTKFVAPAAEIDASALAPVHPLAIRRKTCARPARQHADTCDTVLCTWMAAKYRGRGRGRGPSRRRSRAGTDQKFAGRRGCRAHERSRDRGAARSRNDANRRRMPCAGGWSTRWSMDQRGHGWDKGCDKVQGWGWTNRGAFGAVSIVPPE